MICKVCSLPIRPGRLFHTLSDCIEASRQEAQRRAVASTGSVPRAKGAVTHAGKGQRAQKARKP
jgi:hypothetical protein